MKKLMVLWGILSIAYSPTLIASALGVWPINPRIDAPASGTLVWVKNNSKSEAVVLQARVFLWRQADNNDQLIPQDELVVSPPIIEVKALAQQIFRVMNREGVIQNVTQENSYRLLIDEVPKEERPQDSLLRFQMRYSLPLFTGIPQNFANAPIADRLKKMAAGLSYKIILKPEALIEITNRSPAHARLSKLTVHDPQLPEKKVLISEGLLGYVLPNSTRYWPLTAEQLKAITQKNITLTFEQEHLELSIDGKE